MHLALILLGPDVVIYTQLKKDGQNAKSLKEKNENYKSRKTEFLGRKNDKELALFYSRRGWEKKWM